MHPLLLLAALECLAAGGIAVYLVYVFVKYASSGMLMRDRE